MAGHLMECLSQGTSSRSQTLHDAGLTSLDLCSTGGPGVPGLPPMDWTYYQVKAGQVTSDCLDASSALGICSGALWSTDCAAH
jgi:hypothetical protein